MPMTLVIPSGERFDEETNQFITIKGTTLTLEHSLVSLAKWESKWHIPFLDKTKKLTSEQSLDYIRCMALGKVDDSLLQNLSNDQIREVVNYIDNPMTATWFSEDKKTASSPSKRRGNTTGEVVTAEIIYYWMVAFQIPFECQKWHLNRLLTLIRVCEKKSEQPKKMSKREIAQRNKALNEARRAKHHSRG